MICVHLCMICVHTQYYMYTHTYNVHTFICMSTTWPYCQYDATILDVHVLYVPLMVVHRHWVVLMT